MKRLTVISVCVLVSLVSAYCAIRVLPVFAEEDPAIQVIVGGSNHVDGTGWYAGWVDAGGSGTYTLQISADGPESKFPVTDVKVIAVISDAAAGGGLLSLTIDNMPITGFTQTSAPPPYYGANGGPFSEPDYYGYNDTYVIPQLTFDGAHWPDHYYPLSVTIEFASTATTNSKVMFLCYGTDASGNAAKTPFSQGTMFVIPFYPSTAMGVGAMVGVLGLYYFKKGRTKKQLEI